MSAPISVWVLTGFLGAGKTTTLNQLLRLPRFATARQALIINEFGKMGVDGCLVEPGEYSLYEINRGSIFCSCTQAELLKTLQHLAVSVRPEHLFIEATGIAQPSDLEPLIKASTHGERFVIEAIIAVVDAEHFIQTAAFMQAAKAQVRCADGLLLNKTDRVDAAARASLEDLLQQLNPRASLAATDHGDVPADFLDRLSHIPWGEQPQSAPPADILAVSLETALPVDRERFLATLRRLGPRVLRLKGNIRFEAGLRFVEVVYDRITEKDPAPDLGPHTRFTVIGWKIDRQTLTEAIETSWQAN
jgi:G3E family GTPase